MVADGNKKQNHEENIQNNAIPKYFHIKTSNKSVTAELVVQWDKNNGLWEYREKKYHQRDIYNVHLNVMHTELLFKLYFVGFWILGLKVNLTL